MASTSDKNDLVDFQDIKFGLEIRKLFCIGESLLYLNSGEHGITPKHLIQKKFDYYALMEKNTDLFVRHLQLDMFEDCKRVISKVLCCEAGSIVFNENSIESLNSILKSICNNSQGSIMIFDFLNESSKKICKYYSKYFNIELIEIATTKEDLNSTSQLISLVEEAISKKTPKLFVLEHIADNSLVLPVLNIVKLLKKSEVISVIDGSNSFGQISINLSEIDPDYYFLNCHNWWFNPKSLSIMYVCKELQSVTHPANISVYNKGDFLQKFRYLGTRDVSSVLCIKDSLEFREKLGESKIQSYIHDLATEGKKVVEKVWKSKALIEKDELITGMFAIQIPEEFNKYPLDKLEEDLIENDKTYVKLIRYKNHNYVRFCCQIINELQEIESSSNLIYQKLLKTNSST